MKEAFGAVGCVVLTILTVIVLSVGSWGLWVYTAEWRGRGEAHVEIQSSENRIVRYERFFDLCTSVQTAEVSLDSEYARLASTTNERTQDQIMENISGIQAARARGVNEYNAAANDDYISGQFRAWNLPAQLNLSYEPGGTKTRCAT